MAVIRSSFSEYGLPAQLRRSALGLDVAAYPPSFCVVDLGHRRVALPTTCGSGGSADSALPDSTAFDASGLGLLLGRGAPGPLRESAVSLSGLPSGHRRNVPSLQIASSLPSCEQSRAKLADGRYELVGSTGSRCGLVSGAKRFGAVVRGRECGVRAIAGIGSPDPP